MIALVFVSVLAAITPNPVHVAVGETVIVNADFSPNWFLYEATLSAEDPNTAFVAGRVAARRSTTAVEVHGLRQGSTPIILSFVSGISVYRWKVGDVIVGPCIAPTIVLDTGHARINSGETMTLTAIPGGTGLVHVEWQEGDVYLGSGSTLTLATLTPGTHRITARALNHCGIAAAEVVVEVVTVPRRRRRVRS